MTKFFRVLPVVFMLLICSAAVYPVTHSFAYRIEGVVYDPDRNPVAGAYVELYNPTSSMIGHDRTNGQGRFTFTVTSTGRYTVRVKPFGTNLLEEEQEAEFSNRVRSDTVALDFRLRLDKRINNITPIQPAEVVFAQDIPENARKLYQSGVAKLETKNVQGLKDLEAAIEIFPDYFDARSRLGRELVSDKQFEKGYPHLLKAIDQNQRCETCYYSLTYAFYQLKQYPAAVKAGLATAVLEPRSVDVYLLLGTVLRLNGNNEMAEKALLKAKALSPKPNPEIHWQLSLVYNRMKRNEDAAVQLETYLQILPDAPNRQQVMDTIAKLRAHK